MAFPYWLIGKTDQEKRLRALENWGVGQKVFRPAVFIKKGRIIHISDGILRITKKQSAIWNQSLSGLGSKMALEGNLTLCIFSTENQRSKCK